MFGEIKNLLPVPGFETRTLDPGAYSFYLQRYPGWYSD